MTSLRTDGLVVLQTTTGPYVLGCMYAQMPAHLLQALLSWNWSHTAAPFISLSAGSHIQVSMQAFSRT